jgi:ubiquitin-like 1-activating enzyme E1 B
MGSPEFYQKVFEKVFKEDIERLRGMEDMWKTRTAPQPLDFEKLQQESSSIEPIVSVNDQKVWSLAEDFVVFKDRSETLPLQTILREQ